MPSTFFCAPAIDRATHGCSIGSTSRLSISLPIRSAAGPKIFIRSSSREMKNLLEPRLLGLVDHIGAVVADHVPMGRDRDHVELVDLVELLSLGQRGAGHAGQLLVLAKVVLDGDRGDRLLLLLDLDALLRLDRLV